VNPQLHDASKYVTEHLSKGYTEAQLRDHMFRHGWSHEWIDQAFEAANNKQQLPPSQANPLESPANTRQKYRVFDAISDSIKAIRENPLTFLTTVIISYAIAIATVVGAVAALIAVWFGGNILSGRSPAFPVIILGIIIVVILFAAASAFLEACIALAIANKQNRLSIKEVLSTSIKATPRVTGANALMTLLIWGPLLFMFVPLLITSLSSSSPGKIVLTSLLFLIFAVWAIIASLRYALMPYVVLFEPSTNITEAMGRSKLLLQKGGQWFLIKGVLLIILIYAVISLITGMTRNEIESTDNAVVNLILILMNILAITCLTMLYLNRKQVRK
jgi:hypothetical protein